MPTEGDDRKRQEELLPPYWHEKKPSYWRRAFNHDYSGRFIYTITVVKMSGVPDFGKITTSYGEKPENAWCRLSELGMIIKKALNEMQVRHPAVRTMQSVIMPDHLHIMLYFTVKGDLSLGEWVGSFKNLVNTLYWEKVLKGEGKEKVSVFISKFHDRLIRDRRHLAIENKYILENPRRLYMKINCLDYFRVCGRIRVGEREYTLYGNPLIITKANIFAVKVSRKDSEEKQAAHRRRWLYEAARDMVLASPFINPKEFEIYREAAKMGADIVLIRDKGFNSRFKPDGRYFDHCAAGHLLILGETEMHFDKTQNFRAKCLEMNATSALLAAGDFKIIELKSASGSSPTAQGILRKRPDTGSSPTPEGIR